MALVKTSIRFEEKQLAKAQRYLAKKGLNLAEWVRDLVDANLKGVKA